MDSFWAKCSSRKKKLWRAERWKKKLFREKKKIEQVWQLCASEMVLHGARSVQSIDSKKFCRKHFTLRHNGSVNFDWLFIFLNVLAEPIDSPIIELRRRRNSTWKMPKLIKCCCIDETAVHTEATSCRSNCGCRAPLHNMLTFFFFVVDVLIYFATEFFKSLHTHIVSCVGNVNAERKRAAIINLSKSGVQVPHTESDNQHSNMDHKLAYEISRYSSYSTTYLPE